ncbi:aliphatic sulfonate ABC transporter substrate-binding protein [Clostridium sp. WILCCON 0269]|uniref:Aliphatic sulfonate ABC transporter substrate-binding protein n=1 Tax=Candidatus Clostridium eludens TaxID=3381663 RepID=A0ABW8SJ92_9CLOT
MKIKRIISILAVISIVGVLAGCGSNNQQSSESTRVAIGFFPNITHSQALVGKHNKSFEKALGNNAKVEWKQFNAGSSEIEAFLAGALDIGYIGPGPAINGYSKSKGDVQIIAGATDAGAILVSRKDEPIKSVKELANKKVAVPQFGNTQDLSLRNLLNENGLKDKTKGGNVEIVQADNPDIKTLLVNKQIDAALVPEPWGSRLVVETGANIVLDYNQVWRDGKYPTAVVIVRKEFLQKHADLVEKFLKTHVELTSYIQKNNSEASSIVNEEIYSLTKSKLSNGVLSSAFKRITTTNNPEKDAINEMVDLSVSTGFLKEKPDTSNIINFELLNKVLKEKGEKEIQ